MDMPEEDDDFYKLKTKETESKDLLNKKSMRSNKKSAKENCVNCKKVNLI